MTDMTEEQMEEGFRHQVKMYQGLGPNKMHEILKEWWDEKYGTPKCHHLWLDTATRLAPDGRSFRVNRQMSTEPVCHVVCRECGIRTWMTMNQWLEYLGRD